MRKINDPKELNEIYGQINNFIQEYIESHNILPSEIYKYVKKNMIRFLEKNNLQDIERINQIVEDVIKHRLGMEKDQVLSFNKFSTKLNESVLSTTESTIEHEKVLADFYNTSVGHVRPINTQYHLYQIKSFNEEIKSIIFSNEEIEMLKKNISEKIKQEISSKVISIDSVLGINFGFNIGYSISEIVAGNSINLPDMEENQVYRVICALLENYLGDIRIYRKTPEKFGNFLIWEVKDNVDQF